MEGEWIVLLVLVAIFWFFTSIVVWISSIFTNWSCKSKYADFNPTRWLIQWCMIEHQGLRIPSSNFRLVD